MTPTREHTSSPADIDVPHSSPAFGDEPSTEFAPVDPDVVAAINGVARST